MRRNQPKGAKKSSPHSKKEEKTIDAEEQPKTTFSTSKSSADGPVLPNNTQMPEHRQMENSLRESEAKYRMLFESTPVGIAIIDAGGSFVTANQSMQELLSYSIEELRELNLAYLLIDQTEREELLKRLLDPGWTRDWELELKMKGGTKYHVLLNMDRIGTGDFLLITMRDITKRKNAEAMLQRALDDLEFKVEERTAELETTNIALSQEIAARKEITSTLEERMNELNFLYLVSAVIDQPGFDIPRIMQNVVQLLPSAWLYSEIASARITFSDQCFETEGFQESSWMQTASLALYGKNVGQITVSYAKECPEAAGSEEGPFRREERLLIDTIAKRLGKVIERIETENARMRAVSALRESEETVQSLLNASIEPVLLIDNNGIILTMNETGAQLFDVGLGNSFFEALSLDEVNSEEISWQAILSSKVPLRFEKELDGVILDFNIYPIFDAHEKVDRLAIFAQNITTRRSAEEKLQTTMADLERSNLELEQFAYVASHDLQTPLRVISGYLQLLESNYESKLDESGKEFIAFACDAALRMQGMIEDLLTFSRVGTTGRSFEPTDCNAVLDYVLILLGNRIEASGAEISRSALPIIMADESQLEQLWQNLIGNALKFRKADVAPHIQVGASRRDEDWLFSVKDNGIGIGSQYYKRIFALFERLHGQTEYEGTGLGLSICKKIVERHGGRIWVDSTLGEGTTFYFTMPQSSGAQT